MLLVIMWLAGTIPTELLPIMAPVILVCGMMFGLLRTFMAVARSEGTRHFFVTNRRVLVFTRGSESGAYTPKEMKEMTFTRAFFVPTAGDIVFSASTIRTSQSSTTYIKGLMNIDQVNAAARAIHDHILAADEEPEER